MLSLVRHLGRIDDTYGIVGSGAASSGSVDRVNHVDVRASKYPFRHHCPIFDITGWRF
jgi:hypothetical protein